MFSMGKEKSLGWDGLIVEFFQEFWEELKEAILTTSNQAFMNGSLENNIKRGIIKPIPKVPSFSLLKQWRYITMMIVMYKIIAKILATRLAPFSIRGLPHINMDLSRGDPSMTIS